MSELILCNGDIAPQPFYIESAELNIYSIEELCWYIRHHLYTLGRELMTEDFIAWTEHELSEKELAASLRQIRRSMGTADKTENDAIYRFHMTILLSCGYFGKRELEECDEILKSLRDKSVFECRKLRADHYLAREYYAKAISEYRVLLDSEDAAGELPEVIGNAYHNLGCAYAGLFLFPEAEQCFLSAAVRNHSPETNRLLSLTRILKNGRIPTESAAGPEYLEAERNAEAMKHLRDTESFYEEYRKLASFYKKEYRRNSQVL